MHLDHVFSHKTIIIAARELIENINCNFRSSPFQFTFQWIFDRLYKKNTIQIFSLLCRNPHPSKKHMVENGAIKSLQDDLCLQV